MTGTQAIIYGDDTADPTVDRFDLGRGAATTTILPAPDPETAARIAAELVDDGVEVVQLCGASGPLWTAQVTNAVGNRALVGTVLFGMESLTSVADYKHRFSAGEPLSEAFIIKQNSADPVTDRIVKHPRTYIAVPDDTTAATVAAELDNRPGGLDLIELFGRFGPGGTAQVIEATGGGRVPIGAVYYSPHGL
jgi:hypothetical protein